MTRTGKKAGFGFWVTVALVATLVGYPLSFGPASVSRRCHCHVSMSSGTSFANGSRASQSIAKPAVVPWGPPACGSNET